MGIRNSIEILSLTHRDALMGAVMYRQNHVYVAIEHIVVAYHNRRRRCGMALIREMERKIAHTRRRGVHAVVDSSNVTACHFFKACGWDPTFYSGFVDTSGDRIPDVWRFEYTNPWYVIQNRLVRGLKRYRDG